MAYEISFAPSAAQRMETLAPSLQRHILDELQGQAAQVSPELGKSKKLKRIQVEGHRLVLLELYASEQLLVLKVADPGDMVRRLKGLPDPAPESSPLHVSEPPAPEPETTSDAPAKRESETSGETAAEPPIEATEPGKAADREETTSAPNSGDIPENRPQGPGWSRLRTDFLDQAISKGESLLEELHDLTLARQWGVRIAGSAGAYGLTEMAELGRSLAEISGENDEEASQLIQTLLGLAHKAKLE